MKLYTQFVIALVVILIGGIIVNYFLYANIGSNTKREITYKTQAYIYNDNAIKIKEPLLFDVNTKDSFDSNTDISFLYEKKSDWEKENKLDNVCDGLGDPDCGPLTNWVQRKELFEKALKDNNVQYPFGYELSTISQRKKVINNIPFIVGVSLGINGGCKIDYVTFQNNIELVFSAKICDDPYLVKNPNALFDASPQTLQLWADRTIDVISPAQVTKEKMKKIEAMITTMYIQ